MQRRTFVRLMAVAASAKAAGLDAAAKRSDLSPLAGDGEIRTDVPPVKLVSAYKPAATPGMPGPFPGRVISVASDTCVDTSTGQANDEVVKEMMARGMRELTGAASTRDAWARFFNPADVVGIKVNCGGYPYCISGTRLSPRRFDSSKTSAFPSRRSTSTSGSRTSALNHVLDARHRQADGQAHALAPGGRRPGAGAVRARVRARAVGALVRAPRRRREHADRGARARREPLLRPRLHALPEALDAAEHRHRRRGRSGAAARRLGGCDREPDVAGARAVRGRLPLDAAALLGARAADQARLRGRRACRCCRSCAESARPRGRSCSTRSGSSPSRSRRRSGACSGSSTSSLPRRSAASSSGSPGGSSASARRAAPQPLFHYSLAYLALLFVAMAVDSVIA